MIKITEQALLRFIVKENFFAYAAKFTILLGLAVAAPFFHFQAITGTIVNAALIMAIIILGRKEAIMIGIFPSIISVITGLLVPTLVFLVPFIIFSNIILIFTFDFLRRKNYWKGVIWGSVLKFSFLFISGIILVKIFQWNGLAKIIAMMFSWQQLLTALSGGIVAYATLRVLKKV